MKHRHGVQIKACGLDLNKFQWIIAWSTYFMRSVALEVILLKATSNIKLAHAGFQPGSVSLRLTNNKVQVFVRRDEGDAHT